MKQPHEHYNEDRAEKYKIGSFEEENFKKFYENGGRELLAKKLLHYGYDVPKTELNRRRKEKSCEVWY